MTARTTERAAESGHWYARNVEDGSVTQVVEVIGKNGKRRKPTLRDARANGWVCGVTTIIKQADAPQLTAWRIKQAVLAALTLPREEGESEADWLARVDIDMNETAKAAAEEGSRLHANLEAHFAGELVEKEYAGHVAAVLAEIEAHGLGDDYRPERAACHVLGYATKCDLHGSRIILDWKTKDVRSCRGGVLPDRVYESHIMQLAATRRALEWTFGYAENTHRCGIMYVSRELDIEPQARWVEVDAGDLRKGWEMFQALHAYWTRKTGHMPWWTTAALEAMNEE